jgi:outer membrane lipoprotein-sorting protein
VSRAKPALANDRAPINSVPVQSGSTSDQGMKQVAGRLAIALLLPLALTPAMSFAPAIAQSATEIGRIQAHLKSVSTMTANFVQTDRGGKSLSGVLTLARPGKIRFQYEKGVPILLVSDGSALTFIDYSVKQVQRWPIKNSPLGALLDPDRDMARYARVLAGSDGQSLLAEVKDPKHPEYGTITLAFQRSAASPGGLMLMGWVALDSQNNRTSIRLSNQRFNLAVSGEAFKWSDPRPKIHRR